jgi:hypothetical protein
MNACAVAAPSSGSTPGRSPTSVESHTAGDRLRYLHIGESHRGYLGTGTVDFDALFGAVRDVG